MTGYKDKYVHFQVYCVLRKGIDIASVILIRPMVPAADERYMSQLYNRSIAQAVIQITVSFVYLTILWRAKPFVPMITKFTCWGRTIRVDVFNHLETAGVFIHLANQFTALALILECDAAETCYYLLPDSETHSVEIITAILAIVNVTFAVILIVTVVKSFGIKEASGISAASKDGGAKNRRRTIAHTKSSNLRMLNDLNQEINAAVKRRSYRTAENKVRAYKDEAAEIRRTLALRGEDNGAVNNRFNISAEEGVAEEARRQQHIKDAVWKYEAIFGIDGALLIPTPVERADAALTCCETLRKILLAADQKGLFAVSACAHEKATGILKQEINSFGTLISRKYLFKGTWLSREGMSRMRRFEALALRFGKEKMAKAAYKFVVSWARFLEQKPPERQKAFDARGKFQIAKTKLRNVRRLTGQLHFAPGPKKKKKKSSRQKKKKKLERTPEELEALKKRRIKNRQRRSSISTTGGGDKGEQRKKRGKAKQGGSVLDKKRREVLKRRSLSRKVSHQRLLDAMQRKKLQNVAMNNIEGESNQDTIMCPGGHVYTPQRDALCDYCGGNASRGCRLCDWDVCERTACREAGAE